MKFADNGHLKATEFVLRFANWPFYTIEAPVSPKLWDFNFPLEPRYPEYAHLTLAEAPTDNDRISIFWQPKFPDTFPLRNQPTYICFL
ncbi:hypothetical protein MVEN_00436300 [Mycena venus]|uniref:Uncharacterized protein n=1 Tax=Mycena venus TaxID=2733690 RepID=A0A8H6YUS9_9AGAR|nr:hypothetical protein MVEN_00436300 [Mycena venus]